MKHISTFAVAVALTFGGIAATPALAQRVKAEQRAQARAEAKSQVQVQSGDRKFNISKEAQTAIADLQTALKNRAPDFPQRLAAAQAVARTNDDKYVIAKFQLERALQDNDKAAQRAAAEAILASGAADASEAATLNNYLAGAAVESGDFTQAEALFAQRVAANPNDIDSVVNLARAKMELKKDGEALTLLQRAISLSKAAGQNAPEAWYRNALGLAHKQRNDAVALELAQEVQKLYPNSENFGNLVVLSQASISKDEEAYLDLLRLMHVSGSMKTADDYLRLAEHLDYIRNWGEAKTVLESAARAGKTSPAHAALLSKVSARIAEDRAALPEVEPKARAAANGKLALSLASVYAGYGDYAKAADLYQVALQKGGVDANLVNTRLGIALALAGQRAEAEAAFRKVTGLRTPLANLWLAWLAQRG